MRAQRSAVQHEFALTTTISSSSAHEKYTSRPNVFCRTRTTASHSAVTGRRTTESSSRFDSVAPRVNFRLTCSAQDYPCQRPGQCRRGGAHAFGKVSPRWRSYEPRGGRFLRAAFRSFMVAFTFWPTLLNPPPIALGPSPADRCCVQVERWKRGLPLPRKPSRKEREREVLWTSVHGRTSP